MGLEIERKFLVVGFDWKKGMRPVRCRQGYLCPGSGITVRVRVMGDAGYLTVKGEGSGISRLEYEYVIPVAEADEMLSRLCGKLLVEKNRYTVEHEGREWVVDEFLGRNTGLVLAELELEREDEVFLLPPWAGREVTGDSRYFNASLACHPYTAWKGEME
ncbi:MAG: CYTH domain-containing protein [Desulfobulbaceae bacterium]